MTEPAIQRRRCGIDHRTRCQRRTGMSFQRTRMSADRTLMSVIRTSLSLISFGFTIAQFFEKLKESDMVVELPTSRACSAWRSCGSASACSRSASSTTCSS